MSQTVSFAPENRKQLRALLLYSCKNGAAIQSRKEEAEYKKSVAKVKDLLRKHFEVYPPRERVIAETCPWTTLGAKDMCRQIAVKYSVPYWHVVADANPYL